MKPFIERQLASMHKAGAQQELRHMLLHNIACQRLGEWHRKHDHLIATLTVEDRHGRKDVRRRAHRQLVQLTEPRTTLERAAAHHNGGQPYDESAIDAQDQKLERAFQRLEQVTQLVH